MEIRLNLRWPGGSTYNEVVRNVAFWLTADSLNMSTVQPLYPQEQAFWARLGNTSF
jgi:hypothetical protein